MSSDFDFNKSYLINTTIEVAGLRNCGDVQFAKASGLFQYWIPLFGSKNSSSAFNWLPMLTFGLSADVVAPFPTSVKNNGQNAKEDRIRINDRIFLIPGHCDPTCNLHDWYVLIKDDVVYDLWPVSARGFSF